MVTGARGHGKGGRKVGERGSPRAIRSLPAAEQIGSRILETTGTADLAALRAMDGLELTRAAAQSGMFLKGTIDGHVLPRQLVDIFDRGEQAAVPTMVGFNHDELETLMGLMPMLPSSGAEYESDIQKIYADLAPRFRRPATNKVGWGEWGRTRITR